MEGSERMEEGERTGEIAILMAAGLGTRMRPLTERIPKPLVRVRGVPMIETVIGGLRARGVDEIYVVTGYLGEQFAYLEQKYERLRRIENPDYRERNNISSVYAACGLLGGRDCFLCEADLYLPSPDVLAAELNGSCYFGRYVEGHSDDWVFLREGERIVRVRKGGDDCYNMVGISYFRKEDAALLADLIREAYGQDGNGQLFWDEVVDRNLDRLNLTVHPVGEGQIVEIDTIEELERLDGSYSGGEAL